MPSFNDRLARIAAHLAGESDREPPFVFVVSPGSLPRGHRCTDACDHISFRIDAPYPLEPDRAES